MIGTNRVKTVRHSAGFLRANGNVSSLDLFYASFGCVKGIFVFYKCLIVAFKRKEEL